MAAVPREYHEYVFSWIGRNISFLDGATPSGTPVTGVQVSTGFMLPPNAMVIQVVIIVTTLFNAATTNTIDIGSAATPTALVAAQTLAATGTFISASPAGFAVLSPTLGVELFTRFNFTGANPTTGAGRVAIKYIVDPARRL